VKWLKFFPVYIMGFSGLFSCIDIKQQTIPKPAPIQTFAIHEDGGLIYDPLHRQYEKENSSMNYAEDFYIEKTVKLDNIELYYKVPEVAHGYEIIPIPYYIKLGDKTEFPLAIEATAFEDPLRKGGKNLFDLSLPDDISIRVEYLGSITAHMKPNARQNIEPDFSDEPGIYPAFERHPFTCSGIVESGDIIWFRFKVINTGNTIMDPEGFGGWGLSPELRRKNENGEYKHYSMHRNLYIRDLSYLYPGEAREFWVNFTEEDSRESYRIPPGDYRIIFRAFYRYYKEWNDPLNYWNGAWMFIAEQPVMIREKAEEKEVEQMKVTLINGDQKDKITRYIHTFEEFMTSFDCWQKPLAGQDSLSGILYLQVAPWTQEIVLKLIGTNPVRCQTSITSVKIDNSALTLTPKLHADNCMIENGRRIPLVYTQIMSDMRANIQVSPWPEDTIRKDILRMKNCGVNVCATTAMPWLYNDFHKPEVNHNGDAMKYALDIARQKGLKLEAWGSYPYDRSTVAEIYKALTGDTTYMETFRSVVSHADPNIAKANAAIWLYQFTRWGNAYIQFESGSIPFATEDTRGWMRQDINIRYPIGDLSKKAFREWLQKKYRTIEVLNKEWKTHFISFDEIDPEEYGQVNQYHHRWEYLDRSKAFHDWNKAINDFDEWRTLLRIKNYKESLEIIRKKVPQAVILLRTEGANAIIDGLDPANPNPHYRHILYSQRRLGAIANMIRESGMVIYHSDYTTIPFTPAELKDITRKGMKQGIIPAWLPQFNNMRDIAVNSTYGTDYQIHYNTDFLVKGAMMHTLSPVFTWFKTVIEEGGIPGLLWSDYNCDGFVTETQEKELIFYKEKMEKYLNSPEGKKASTKRLKNIDSSWLDQTNPKNCYFLP